MATQSTPLSRARRFGQRVRQAQQAVGGAIVGGVAGTAQAMTDAQRAMLDPVKEILGGYLMDEEPAPAQAAPDPGLVESDEDVMSRVLKRNFADPLGTGIPPQFGGAPAAAPNPGLHPRVGELDALEAFYNSDPEGYMRSARVATTGGDDAYGDSADFGAMAPHPAEEERVRRTTLTGQGFDEFAPGQFYKGPPLKGGGTVSMMSGSPEAAAHVTQASRFEDLENEIAEARMRELARDPYADERARATIAAAPGIARAQAEGAVKATADADLDRKKQAVIADMRASLDAMQADPSLSRDDKLDWERRIKGEAKVELESIDPRGDYSRIDETEMFP